MIKEQRNTIKNMRQASNKNAADFLVWVSNAVQILNKDWKGHMTQEEFDILHYEVCINSVNEDIQHVLDSEAAKYEELESDQMYNEIKGHHMYIAHNKWLQVKSPYTGQA